MAVKLSVHFKLTSVTLGYCSPAVLQLLTNATGKITDLSMGVHEIAHIR